MSLRLTIIVTILYLVSLHPTAYAQTQPPMQNTSPAAQESPEKSAAVRRLLVLTGSENLAHQMMDQMFSAMQTSMPNVPSSIWTKVRAKFADNSFIERLVPVYEKNYSLEDLNGMIAFYQSPLGHKIIAVTPLITQESMTVGQAWGQEKAAEVLHDLQKEQASKATGASTQ